MAENDGNTPAAEPLTVRRLRIDPSELMPVKPEVFQSIHEINIHFERLIHGLENLHSVPYFPHPKLTAWQNTLGRIQAETNLSLIEPIQHRQQKNALYFDRLCAQWEREISDPDDVLLEAEYRRQELTDEQKRTNEESEESAT